MIHDHANDNDGDDDDDNKEDRRTSETSTVKHAMICPSNVYLNQYMYIYTSYTYMHLFKYVT